MTRLNSCVYSAVLFEARKNLFSKYFVKYHKKEKVTETSQAERAKQHVLKSSTVKRCISVHQGRV